MFFPELYIISINSFLQLMKHMKLNKYTKKCRCDKADKQNSVKFLVKLALLGNINYTCHILIL